MTDILKKARETLGMESKVRKNEHYQMLKEMDPELLEELELISSVLPKKPGTNKSVNIDPQDVKKLAEMGFSAYRISMIYDVSPPTIIKVMKENNITVRNPYKKLAEIIFILYTKHGLTIKQISDFLDMTEMSVRKNLWRYAEQTGKVKELKEAKLRNRRYKSKNKDFRYSRG